MISTAKYNVRFFFWKFDVHTCTWNERSIPWTSEDIEVAMNWSKSSIMALVKVKYEIYKNWAHTGLKGALWHQYVWCRKIWGQPFLKLYVRSHKNLQKVVGLRHHFHQSAWTSSKQIKKKLFSNFMTQIFEWHEAPLKWVEPRRKKWQSILNDGSLSPQTLLQNQSSR